MTGSSQLHPGSDLFQLWEFEKEQTLQGAIILIHPGTQEKRSDKLYLHLSEIIRTLRGKGYDFAGIDE